MFWIATLDLSKERIVEGIDDRSLLLYVSGEIRIHTSQASSAYSESKVASAGVVAPPLAGSCWPRAVEARQQFTGRRLRYTLDGVGLRRYAGMYSRGIRIHCYRLVYIRSMNLFAQDVQQVASMTICT